MLPDGRSQRASRNEPRRWRDLEPRCTNTGVIRMTTSTEADNSRTEAQLPPDTLKEQICSQIKTVREAFGARPVWGLISGAYMVSDYICPSTYIHYAPQVFHKGKTRRSQLIAEDIYHVMFVAGAVVVLAFEHGRIPGALGILSLLRLHELLVVWVAILVGSGWARFTVWALLAYAAQIPLFLAIAMQSLTPSGYQINGNEYPHGAMTFVFIAFTNMTTLGNQFQAASTGAQLLTMLAAFHGLLLFGAVLTSVVSATRREPELRNAAALGGASTASGGGDRPLEGAQDLLNP
jgi:hypothetical protein